MNRQEEHIVELEERMRGLSQKVWDLAEVGFKEYASAGLLAQACREEGFEVETGVAGMPTAFVARFGQGKPVVGFLAEYDALPGLSQKISLHQEPVAEGKPGHGCGHNLLGVAALGAAFALKRSLAETKTPGSVYLFGCPAEETVATKGYMVREGYFDDVDAVFDWHPADANGINMRTTLACDSVIFRYKGRAAHAASNPEWGRSALKAVELMNVGVNYLREHIPGDARIHYSITDGGGEPNVVPADAAVWYFIRSPRRRQVEDLTRRVLLCAEGAAMMTETKLHVKFLDKCYNMLVNETLSRLAHEEFKAVGAPSIPPEQEDFIRGIRKLISQEQVEEALKYYNIPLGYESAMHRHVSDLEKAGGVSPGSTDAADVSWKVPLAHIRVACAPLGTPGHTWQAVSAFGSEVGIQGMLTAAAVLARCGWRVISDPDVLTAAALEHEQNLQKDPFILALTPDMKPPLDQWDHHKEH
jgi:aminobenzoyl-glutamate utilization protein B